MKTLLALAAIGLAWAGGYGYGRWYAKPAPGEKKPLYWVDPMHPWYKSDKPGVAPDCNMKLVPVMAGDEARYERRANRMPEGSVQITPEKQQLIGVEYGAVEYENVSGALRAAARVTLDETKISKVNSKLEGWLEQVFVDSIGRQVNKGEPLVTIYSPEALATQQEYLLAIKGRDMMHDSPVHEMLGSTENLIAAARKRLELWDIGESQIAAITTAGQAVKYLTLYAPASGVVMERNAFAKQRIMPDTVLYNIADLSTVWVVADVFEYEAAGVRIGQAAALTLAYLPGRTFRGHVSYILPTIDPATRTVKVRVEFSNPEFLLKPEMYGEVEFQTGGTRRLVVPQTAVLNSGDRQTVFVDRGNGYFEPRDVKIGAQNSGRTEILSGLKAGERIVISGNFLIDSESQLKTALGGASK
uniref:Efflux transporter, RND family, MFP subunit n=1 Tax=Solibacter usitatus (strain Ellin6076) TaxID=234267 RepID=Q01PJ9_SOLUE